MHPILFNAGPITIYSYGVLLASAYLLGLWLAVKRARAAGIDGNRIMDLLIWVIIAALVGAKALLFVVDFEHFTSSWQEFTTLLRSGGVFYGGLIAAIVVCIWQLRKHRLPLWSSGDLFAPGIALGYMIGRLGCLMAGCCYGKPTTVAWAVTFTDPAANFNVGTPLNVALHPTQL
ncbi:MAG TPA: prolipoprotein diacylglyceryl transferase family protein, partial [Vicinamibacterales bacterium]|nr:prolipoprotein diacylglyceryl transferase family protein [Vicinamibacterales bacterium]